MNGIGEHAESTTEATYTVSAAASLTGMHAQTLRQYDRIGLVTPGRAKGRGRRYSVADIERLREIQNLTQAEGINLAGVHRILELEDEIRALRQQLSDLHEVARTLRASTPGVFTADSEGRVQFSPQPREPGPADTSSESGSWDAGRDGATGQDRAAVKLARQHRTAVSPRGLVGWKLLASLGMQRHLGPVSQERRRP